MFECLTKCKGSSLLPKWVEIWMFTSNIICIFDVCYTMLRPWTIRGGALDVIYEPWNIYADVDYRYADPKDLVTMATGRVMTIEIIMNFVALILNARRSRHTVLLSFTSACFVFWKTVWYMVLYIRQPEGTPLYLNPEAGLIRLIVVFWIADGIWVIVPLLQMIVLWNRLARHEYEECAQDVDSRESTTKESQLSRSP